ncbi:hypothetical protein GU926_11055 [Nibribacter ruber]|uniref:Uncharacterized protein n=1 Tax=Nibribacter ruber TaxID=2698458 RepID=A0A6P1NY36_9BACT|nr:hypothetical protein [Nibribacter ruber]QHL87940.1 hypothetical protein GU926_11055 [Nibribacter ruber]
MQKIAIKELVGFIRRSDRSRKNYAIKLKSREAKVKDETLSEEGGGDYWVTSTSCIYNVFKYDNDSLYDPKVDELRVKHENATDTRIKTMYQRNIDILSSFKEFEFAELKPSDDLKFEKVPKANKVLEVNGFPLFVNPSFLFSYERNGKQELGALWLIPMLNGFKKYELGMFCEVLYRLLIENYAHKYQISPDFCIAVDTYSAQKIVYSELLTGSVPLLIDKTLKEIREL